MKSLYREEQRLKAELERSPLARQLFAVQTVIAAYQAGGAVITEKPKAPTRPKQIAPSVKPGTKTSAIMAAAIEFLRGKNARATSGEIYKYVTGLGIPVGGKKPSATMASYLSNSRLVDNEAGKGYGLVEWTNKNPASEDTGSLFKS